MEDGKKKALEGVLAAIEKNHGRGAVMRMDATKAQQPAAAGVIPSGSVSLDVALGTGGYPRGRIVEVYGPESSGKTTLSLHAIAEAQRLGGTAAFIDAEHALDVSYAKKLGVKVDELLVSQPDNGEQALEITDQLVRSNAVDIIVIDSVAALVPRAEIEGDMGDQLPGLHARLMSQALRKLTAAVNRSNAIVLFINQIRMKIGVMFGNPETTTGGNALKFYSSVRLDVRRADKIKDGETQVGNRTRVKVVKNKMAAPFREVEFDILYGQGISREGDVLDFAVEGNVVEKSGSWFSYKGERIAQGRDAAVRYLAQNPAAFAAIKSEVMGRFNIHLPANDNAAPAAPAEKPAKRAAQAS